MQPSIQPASVAQYPRRGSGGMFSSLISTDAPVSQAAIRQYSQQPQAFRSYGMGAGDQSRTAQARAMADMNRNSLATASEKFNREYRTKSERALAEDRGAQYQNMLGRYNLGLNQQQTIRQQDQQSDLANRQIDQYISQAKKRQKTQLIGDIVGAVVGSNLLGRFSKPAGEAMAGGAGFSFGRQGLLGSLSSYMGGNQTAGKQ